MLQVTRIIDKMNIMFARSFKFSLLLTAFTLFGSACSKTKPSQAVIEKHCHDKILARLKKRPLTQVERGFFKDGKARGILKPDQLSPKAFAEGNSSATALSYTQEFIFVDQKGQPIKLIRDSKNGGIDINGGNIVTPHIQCNVIWGLFKGKVMKDSIKVILAKQDDLQQKMRMLEGLVH